MLRSTSRARSRALPFAYNTDTFVRPDDSSLSQRITSTTQLPTITTTHLVRIVPVITHQHELLSVVAGASAHTAVWLVI